MSQVQVLFLAGHGPAWTEVCYKTMLVQIQIPGTGASGSSEPSVEAGGRNPANQDSFSAELLHLQLFCYKAVQGKKRRVILGSRSSSGGAVTQWHKLLVVI